MSLPEPRVFDLAPAGLVIAGLVIAGLVIAGLVIASLVIAGIIVLRRRRAPRRPAGERIRVLKFGGYTKHGVEFFLHTITNRSFSAMTFMEWYGQKNDWLEPGESVVDPNNYGDPPALWAYYCETQSGRQFVAGGIIE